KAHPDVYNMLLQIMEEGHLTDSFGRKVDFKNVILIMTTNAGAEVISNATPFGFFSNKDEETSYGTMKREVQNVMQKVFKPEFLGRLDEVVIFRKLTKENLRLIVDIELKKVRERLQERGLKLVLTDEARDFLIEKGREGDNLEYGARPLRRSVEMYVEDPLAEELLRNAFEGKNLIQVAVKEVGEMKQLDFNSFVQDEQDTEELAAVGSTGEGPSNS
ncbi:MAG: ATP-dependent Clp protease ATP-binding subunit, partial [Planctomycetaceae bacterium]|nr:ATP-dependent Clp protease ATP-binding subunit [Planctomycetaceae bacterium]